MAPGYRPPPAQAQAHPAQAQAQAQAQPLPPLLLYRPPEETLGGGLVDWVTPPVKPVMLLTMRPAVFWTPFTIEAAKAAPGSVGSCTRPVEGRGVEGLAVVAAGRVRVAHGR